MTENARKILDNMAAEIEALRRAARGAEACKVMKAPDRLGRVTVDRYR
jgi:hypothetical protein